MKTYDEILSKLDLLLNEKAAVDDSPFRNELRMYYENITKQIDTLWWVLKEES